jgi:hypothetical protein
MFLFFAEWQDAGQIPQPLPVLQKPLSGDRLCYLFSVNLMLFYPIFLFKTFFVNCASPLID